MRGKAAGSLTIKVYNGPALWMLGEHLMTEEAAEFVAAHLPVVPLSALREVEAERGELRTALDDLLDWAEHIEGEGRLRRTRALAQARAALEGDDA